MPMSKDFKARLWPVLPKIIEKFGTPLIIMDEVGIRETYQRIDSCLSEIPHRLYFAVKATPIPAILKMQYEMGAGFDCSSVPELKMVRDLGAIHDDIMFTSNNTSAYEFNEALECGGCIVNFDDITLLRKIPVGKFPDIVCFRYNPGPLRNGNEIIGEPKEAKYGVPDDMIITAYDYARARSAVFFGLHTMICSNSTNGGYLVDTVKMLTNVAERLYKELGIRLYFINMGGGLGIPYRYGDPGVEIESMFGEITTLMKTLGNKTGVVPKLFMEFGRYMTGPHGVLVMKAINVMRKYRKIVGVDASMPANPRPGIYGAHHEITVLGKGEDFPTEVVDVGGSLCEGCDKFAVQRELPVIQEEDVLIQHDVGAHSLAMGSDYNFRFIPKVLLLRENRQVECIRRERKYEDHMMLYHGGDFGKTIHI